MVKLACKAILLLAVGMAAVTAAPPLPVGHRGLPLDAPENTLAGFAACLELRIGFELDVRRSKDGHLVCLHDATLDRTTSGKGKVGERTLAELKQLDAGSWLHPAYAAERIPTLEEVLVQVKQRGRGKSLVLLDLKVVDAALAADVAELSRKQGVSGQLVCIGEAITDPALRRALRKQSTELGIAVLAQQAEDLETALKDEPADWAYLRFLPTRAQVEQAHKARKKVLVVGKLVMGREKENWKKARDEGVDAVLTDYPLECRQTWNSPRTP